jgi:hypothetical protein
LSTEYDAIHLIARERTRQKTQEGWTDEHDDEHDNGELVEAAVTYALEATFNAPTVAGTWKEQFWPWDDEWFKLKDNDPIRNLVKAGALIAAEIDRLQRIPKNEEANRKQREAVKRDEINNAKRILRKAGETL